MYLLASVTSFSVSCVKESLVSVSFHVLRTSFSLLVLEPVLGALGDMSPDTTCEQRREEVIREDVIREEVKREAIIREEKRL